MSQALGVHQVTYMDYKAKGFVGNLQNSLSIVLNWHSSFWVGEQTGFVDVAPGQRSEGA